MLDPKDINKLNDYSYNRSSSSDKKELEKMMQDNPDFNKEANFFFRLFRGFKALEVEQLNQNMNKWEEKHQHASVVTETKVFSIGRFFKYAAAAAVILTALPLGYNYLNTSMTADELFATNFSHDTAINYLDSRGSGSIDPFYSDTEDKTTQVTEEEKENEIDQAAIAAVLSRGITAYNEHHYTDATKYFRAYMTTAIVKDKDEVEFYLAVSYLADGHIAEAKPLFEKMIKKGTKARKNNAEWYLVLTLLKENNVDVAQKKLTKIINQPNAHPYKEKALKLQQQIDKYYTK